MPHRSIHVGVPSTLRASPRLFQIIPGDLVEFWGKLAKQVEDRSPGPGRSYGLTGIIQDGQPNCCKKQIRYRSMHATSVCRQTVCFKQYYFCIKFPPGVKCGFRKKIKSACKPGSV